MKNTTRCIVPLVTAVVLFFTFNVNAQSATVNRPDQWRFGIGMEAGAPTGDGHNISNFELGGTARLQYDASNHFAWPLTSGYYNMFGKEMPGSTVHYNSLDIVPLKLGIKAFFALKLYFGAEAGAAFETVSGGNTKLDLSPALGFANRTWDVGIRYENFSSGDANYSLAGLRKAYAFGL